MRMMKSAAVDKSRLSRYSLAESRERFASENGCVTCNGDVSDARLRGKYPSSVKIAEAWNTPGGRKEVKYFWCNRAHGITTFQDAEIEAQLRELGLTPGGSGVEECS